MISNVPENKLDIILVFVQFVLNEELDINALLSEPILAKDWLRKEEDAA